MCFYTDIDIARLFFVAYPAEDILQVRGKDTYIRFVHLVKALPQSVLIDRLGVVVAVGVEVPAQSQASGPGGGQHLHGRQQTGLAGRRQGPQPRRTGHVHVLSSDDFALATGYAPDYGAECVRT